MKQLQGTLPWTKSCHVCGQDNEDGYQLRSRIENGVIVLDYTPEEKHLGYRHIIHGGVSMTLLDEVMTWAAILATNQACVAAEMTTRLKGQVQLGTTLRVEGWVSKARGRLVLTEGHVLDQKGECLVTATGKYMPMPEDEFSLCSDDFVASPESISADKIFGKS